MNLKNLAITNGVVGLVGGIILLFGGFIVLGGAAANSNGSGMGVAAIILTLLKIAIFVLGIIGIVQFNKEPILTKSPSVLLIVGGAIAIIPLLGWVGGILSIIGGSMYLAGLKKFDK